MFEEDDLANELFDPAQRDDLLAGVMINRGGAESDDADDVEDGEEPAGGAPAEEAIAEPAT